MNIANPHVVSEAQDNMAGFDLANGSMSTNQSGEGDIRRALIEADLRADYVLANPPFSPAERRINFAWPRKLVRASPFGCCMFASRQYTRMTMPERNAIHSSEEAES